MMKNEFFGFVITFCLNISFLHVAAKNIENKLSKAHVLDRENFFSFMVINFKLEEQTFVRIGK